MENLTHQSISEKSGLVTLILAIFLGAFGLHRFFVGKMLTGVLMLITCGGFGIWVLVDIIFMIMGKFTDSEGKVVKL